MSDAPAFYSTALEGGRASVWLGDCLEAMGHMDADSVDQVITDPPYEKHMHVNKAQKAHPRGRKIRGDGYAELEVLDFASIEPIRVEAARQMVRVSRGWLLVFCTPEGVAPWRDAIEAAGARYKRACCWIKPDATPQFNGQGPAMGAEMFVAAWCGSGHAHWNAGGKRGVYTFNTNNAQRDGRHPTEKPVDLMRALVRDFAGADDLILDPFMGSGTTGVASLLEGRRFAGFEKDQTYFDVASQRLEWTRTRAGPVVRKAQKQATAQTTDNGPLFAALG
tara:strand:- start:141 stop:974 length:834 start_codon:yes stop_codon:yes gene_type:complete